ncbi:hypothetical protein B0H66DRAFT_606862 [Apodospora peruviana]|uniref:Uncharacterized protein n=1 Tax=Apodospora peruviana TaxID=516989 RepID=A0AAE0LZL6_9PEZI|nr:hypothetical protein B0H66DRAFT_606862 [Apodospora peruviana]
MFAQHVHGIPVPTILWFDSVNHRNPLGLDYMVMERVVGAVRLREALAGFRWGSYEQVEPILGQVHAITIFRRPSFAPWPVWPEVARRSSIQPRAFDSWQSYMDALVIDARIARDWDACHSYYSTGADEIMYRNRQTIANVVRQCVREHQQQHQTKAIEALIHWESAVIEPTALLTPYITEHLVLYGDGSCDLEKRYGPSAEHRYISLAAVAVRWTDLDLDDIWD